MENGRLGDEDGLPRKIATSRTLIDSPGRVLVAIDGKVDGPRDPRLVALVIEEGFQGNLRKGQIGGGTSYLDRFQFFPGGPWEQPPPRTRSRRQCPSPSVRDPPEAGWDR